MAQRALPPLEAMLADIQAKKDEMSRRYVKSERHTIQVDYITYCDEIAGFIGCLPRFWDTYWEDPEVRRDAASTREPAARGVLTRAASASALVYA